MDLCLLKKASTIIDSTVITAIETLVNQELGWVEECKLNFIQRKKYRAVWLLLRDLVHASWRVCYRSGVLELSMPTSEILYRESFQSTKNRLRDWLKESRLERLQTFEKFIRQMETNSATKQSVLQLVADGTELAHRLRSCADIHQAVRPRLELVEGLLEYLKAHEWEVLSMLIADYDPDLAEKRAEERGEKRGERRAEKRERERFVINLVKDNIPIEKICVYTGLTPEDIEKLQDDTEAE